LLAVAAAGVAFAVAVVGVTAGDVTHALPVVFVAGAIAICAMILPGVSGAFLLLVLGQYEYMLSVLNGFVEGIAAVPGGGSLGAVFSPGGVVAVFLTGAVIGLFTVSHAINWALEHYRVATLTFLVSLMVGGLRLPAERVCQHALLDTGAGDGHVQSTGCLTDLASNPGAVSLTGGELVSLLAAGLFGAIAVLAFDHFTDDLDYA
jgi:putative membrane protein